jgi:predicted RNase H-like HicB family nuclease
MKYTVLLTKENLGHFRAVVANLPHCQVQANTRDQALSEIRDLISRFLSQTEMVQLEIPSTPSPNSPRLEETPWQWFGAFQEDPTWGPLFEEIERQRG